MKPIYVLGGDTAPSEKQTSDDGALVVGAALPRRQLAPGEPMSKNESDWYLDFVYARVFNSQHKLSADQWSGFIYGLDRRFGGLAQVTLDAGSGGGGVYVKRAMLAKQQTIGGSRQNVIPICDKLIETQQSVDSARFLLNMFKRGDPGVESVWPDVNDAGKSMQGDELLKDAVFCDMRSAFTLGTLRQPPEADEYQGMNKALAGTWDKERLWALKNLTIGGKQLINIVLETVEKDGEAVEVRTSRGARKFNSLGKDDVALAMIYCYTAFRIWLQGEEFEQPAEADLVGFEGR